MLCRLLQLPAYFLVLYILMQNFTRILNKLFLKQTKEDAERKANTPLIATEFHLHFLTNMYATNILIFCNYNDYLNIFDFSVSCQ